MPLHRGFDGHFGTYHGKGDFYEHISDNGKNARGYDFRDQEEDVARKYAGRYATELYAERAQKIITEHNKTKPLFLYMPFQAPHSANHDDPLQAPYKHIAKLSHIKDTRRRKYAAMVSAVDEAVGNVIQTLNEQGMLNNSIIIFSSDNGGPPNGLNYNWASNYPLRGAKGMLWEGGTRAAAFAWSPLFRKSGYISNHMMHITDWLPTLVGQAAGDGHKCEIQNKNIPILPMAFLTFAEAKVGAPPLWTGSCFGKCLRLFHNSSGAHCPKSGGHDVTRKVTSRAFQRYMTPYAPLYRSVIYRWKALKPSFSVNL